MKRVMTAALVLSLLGGTSAFAQQGEWRGRGDGERREGRQERREDRQEQRQEQRREPRQEQRREGRQEQRGEARQQRQERREALPPQRGSPGNPAVAEQLRRQQQQQARQQQEQRRDRDWDRGRDGRNDQRWDRDRDRGDWQRNYRPGQGRNFRDRDRGRHWYSPGQWRHSYHAPRRYRAPAYRYPSGWHVRSWVWGDILPRTWFTPHYYLDWRYYGLPVPPIGTEWVRVGDDALLVDVWTGRVLTVYYDLFW